MLDQQQPKVTALYQKVKSTPVSSLERLVCFYFMYNVCPAPCVQYPQRLEQGIRFPEAGVTEGCEMGAVWALGTKPPSSAKAVIISPTLPFLLLFCFVFKTGFLCVSLVVLELTL